MTQVPADWYPDPLGRYELRYWDGEQWSDHVATQGVQALDPLLAAQLEQARLERARSEQAAQQEQPAQGGAQGGGTVLTEPVLVVCQRPKVVEVTDEYVVCDQRGRQIGSVREVAQSGAKKAARLLFSVDQFMSHTLQITDMSGQVLLQIVRPAKLFKSRVIVQNGHGQEVGQILQQSVWGKIRFSLESGGHQYGSLNAENWRAWDFEIQDDSGTEVARITKTWEGLAAAMFTTADNYVVRIHRPLEDPLRSLLVAAALAIDLALKQDASDWD